MTAVPIPRWMEERRGHTWDERIKSAEIDLDKHDAAFDGLREDFTEMKDDLKAVKRLMIGLLCSTTAGAIMFALSVVAGR